MFIRWLDGHVVEGEKIRRIQRFDTTFNQNGKVCFCVNVKTDRDVHMMMYSSHEIVLMVVIAYLYCLIIVFVCVVV